jgi:tetratricopeptide (TPR) repeat protein
MPLNQSDKSAGQAELIADPSRQAIPLFKGIDYQIWQTVLAWIDLGENEILVVEGAEDFDVLSETSATGNQVKNLAAPISLRSDCVCEALRNFWTTRHKNSPRIVRLRFITTAGLSVEANEPFGSAKPGLELWNEEASRATPQHSGLLKDFLLSDDSVLKRLAEPFGDGVPSLVEHLRGLSLELFHAEFISAIQWLPQQPDIEVARQMVRVKLHAYGEDKGLLVSDCDRALPALFEHVAHVAIRERRFLDREDFRVLFDGQTRMSMPLSQYNQMVAVLAHGLQATTSATSEMNYSVAETISIPDLPVPCAPRTAFVDTLATCITEHRFVAIQGSKGMGKSTLAKLLARQLGGNWLWASFAGWKAERVSAELDRLSRQVARLALTPCLLLDDFNPTGADLPSLLQKLAVLSRLTLMHGGRMIVTTQRLLGNVFLRQSNLLPPVLHQVTAFYEDEVRELCLQAGCPPDNQLTSWVKIISTHTGRHPQLVHARVKVASRRGWPTPTITDVLETPQEVRDERQLARQLLEELDNDEVELLYRLSLASGAFRKDQVIAVGEILPPVNRPGDKFDALVGPWIEPAGNSYFRLSSLLARAAEENWTPERVITMRVQYAKAIQRAGALSLREANEGLFQAIMARNAELAGAVLGPLMLVPVKSRDVVAEWFDWTLLLADPSSVFRDNQSVTYLFSSLQFRVATSLQAASAPKFAGRLFKESNKSIDPAVDSHIRISTAMDILLAFQVLVEPSLLLRCWLDVVSIADKDEQLRKAVRSMERQRRRWRHVFPTQNFAEISFGFILARHASISYLRKFVAAVDALTTSQREQVVAAVEANRFRLYSFVDDAWTHELTRDKPDWNEAVTALEEAYQAGERWGAKDLCMIAARGIAAIQDEYLKKKDEALKTLDKTTAKLGDGLMVRYQRGMVHFLNNEYAESYKAWSSTLDEWPTDSEEGALYGFPAFSNCGAAAGFLNRWEDAAAVFAKGRDLARKVRRKLDALKFGIDAAYAQWRAGLREQAIAEFVEYLKEMEQLGRTATSTEFHTHWKVMEHILLWCSCDAGAPHNLKIFPPPAGICSEVKTKEKHDLVKEAPRGPALLSWYFLAEAELYAGVGRRAFSALVARSDVNDYPHFRPLIDFLRARRELADGEFVNVPVFAEIELPALSTIDVTKLTERVTGTKPIPIPSSAESMTSITSFVEESLLCALLAMSADNIAWESVLDQWSAVAPRMRHPAILTTAISTIKRICSATPMEIYRNYAGSTAPRFSQVVAGLQLVVHPETKPALCYVALCMLVRDGGFATNMMLSHEALAKLTRKAWLARLSAPFELCSPRLTVPAIRAACDSHKKGLALAATILLAAGDAVSVSKSSAILTALRKLADGTDENHIV